MRQKLTYQFTTNPKFLRQYYRLRKIIYNVDLGISIPDYKDHIDSISETLVVRKKQKCVGGCRLTICTPNSRNILPFENEDFRLYNLLPHLNLKKNSYAEFSRLVLLSEYRNSKIAEKMYAALNKKAKQHGIRYIFVITDKVHARRYMRSYRKLGYNVEIISSVDIPESVRSKYSGIVECLIMLDLKPERNFVFQEKMSNVVELMAY